MMMFTQMPSSPHHDPPSRHDPFMQSILVANGGYHRDPRWVVVRHMKKNGQRKEAEELVQIIKEAWGVD